MSNALKICLVYFTFSFLWIYFSDNLLLYLNLSNETLTFIQTIKGLAFIIITTLLLYILIKSTLLKIEKIVEEKEKIINTIASPVIIFNEEGEVIRVNKAVKEITGYSFKEINHINKWSKIDQDNKNSLINTLTSLYDIKKTLDNGEFNIKTKDGKNLIWHFKSAPYGIKNNKRVIISNALDVTQVRSKEKLLMQQSKMAAMGEVLENIAHQWRQPLSTISSASTGIKLQKEIGVLNDEMLIESLDIINHSSQFLSKTIDDFRSFFKPEQEKQYFNFDDVFEKVKMIVNSKFKTEEIELIKTSDETEILNYSNALIQVLINIFNNSKDAFIENKIDKRFIFVDAFKKDDNLIIKIKDNAGGISSDIIDKVFEPYFTTKHKTHGTGIGLYMCEEIVTKHMLGKIEVQNEEFTFEDTNYKGTLFTIELPLL
ncbi:MAG: ATP-binding protein [Halarcobacter ebronensis]|uniref:PAS domain-containing sensor histidine kinase n=1 Tax=Halarcobacter ebronensis TaxID=1462615 RepID=UPI003C72DBD2